ncbi:hypothetical protein [Bacteroides reticulotermitis]|uniref:Uncharacterized protein n=1 Tax=Bacteroides reticulotermitis JCM 10512 TaxID=1445607 RepID=W4UPE7_9BACE|nr:hypothetical protein [Bacteroides reticulotermitis]GAE82821.1 hypothetical protein JCM10512_1053 [Bacteroides reticulotermitis JCM 10512]
MNMIRNNWLAGVLLLSGLTACTGGLEDANVDPNKMLVGDVNPYGMFEPLLYNGGTTGRIILGTGMTNLYSLPPLRVG